jgi:hypothetical protein
MNTIPNLDFTGGSASGGYAMSEGGNITKFFGDSFTAVNLSRSPLGRWLVVAGVLALFWLVFKKA